MDENIHKLHYAAYIGDLGMVMQLLSNGEDINVQNSKGYTVIMATLLGDGNKKRKGEILNHLLQNQVNVNALTNDGESVLHIAVRASTTKIVSKRFVKALLHYGADNSLENRDGKTASQLAYQLGNAKLGEYLMFYDETPHLMKTRKQGVMSVLFACMCPTFSFRKQLQEDIAVILVDEKTNLIDDDRSSSSEIGVNKEREIDSKNMKDVLLLEEDILRNLSELENITVSVDPCHNDGESKVKQNLTTSNQNVKESNIHQLPHIGNECETRRRNGKVQQLSHIGNECQVQDRMDRNIHFVYA